jgi:uncharacterized protein (DUF427 family)
MMAKQNIRIIHTPSDTVIAEGPIGWGITAFEGNYYIGKQYLKTDRFKVNYIPGLCFYKFLYVGLNFHAPDGTISRNLGWKYWLPNPLLPFIIFRVAVPQSHPELKVEEISDSLITD